MAFWGSWGLSRGDLGVILGDLGGLGGILEICFFRRLLVGGLQFFSWAVKAGLCAPLVVYRLSLHVLCHLLSTIQLSSRPVALK